MQSSPCAIADPWQPPFNSHMCDPPVALNHPQDDNCWRICATCNPYPVPTPYPIITPDNTYTSGDYCQSSGNSYGPSAAQQACQQAMQSCNGPILVGSGMGSSIGGVSMAQCSNIAAGACTQVGCSSDDSSLTLHVMLDYAVLHVPQMA